MYLQFDASEMQYGFFPEAAETPHRVVIAIARNKVGSDKSMLDRT